MRAMYSSLVYIFTILAFLMLLPLQGARLIALIPRVLPWARSFCPFWACGGKVSKVPLHRPCGTSRVSCRSFLLWISSLCSHLPAQNHNKNPRQGDNLLGDLLWSGPGNCGDFQFPSSGARWFRACVGYSSGQIVLYIGQTSIWGTGVNFAN